MLLGWFLLSGMTGLAYEVIWTRMFTTFFGASLPALSAVTASFLFGLGLGARWLGARVGRMSRPLAVYGLLEIGVGLYAVASPAILHVLEPFLLPVLGMPPAVLALARIGAAMLFLFPPTFCMGGTLPVLVQFWGRRQPNLARRLGFLYAANTLGAAGGALVAGNLLLATVGISRGLAAAAALNFLIGIAALLWRPAESSAPEGEQQAAAGRQLPPGLAVMALLLGAASLAHQVAWARALSPFFGSSIYAASAVIGSFLTGIAGGSLLLPRLLAHEPDGRRLLASLQTRLAFYVLFFTAVVPGLPAVYLAMFRLLGEHFWGFLGAQYLLVLLITMVPTGIMGAAFPLLCLLAAPKGEGSGDATGRVYFWNSAGNLVGALATGFLLIPAIGIQRTIGLGAMVNAGVGLALCDWRRPPERRSGLYRAGVLLLFWVLVPGWSRETLVAGPYALVGMLGKRAPAFARTASTTPATPAPAASTPAAAPAAPTPSHSPSNVVVQGVAERFKVVYYREGAHCNVAVAQDEGGFRTLTIDGKADASTLPGDMLTQILIGHLPVLASKHPRRVLVIGLGSGITVGAVARHRDVAQIDCVEIEPAVYGAAKHFADANEGVLDDPRLHMRFEDARAFLRVTKEPYDVLISEPSNLWMGGVSHLFTREHFIRSRQALAPDGVFCQWLHLYQIGKDDFRMALKTMLAVFPQVRVFPQQNGADAIILASVSRDLSLLPQWPADPGLQADLRRAGLAGAGDPRLLPTANERSLAPRLLDMPINTDEHPRLEFATARHQFTDDSREIGDWLEGR